MICSLHDRQFAFSLSLIEGAYHSAWPLSYEGKLSIEPKSFTMSIPLQHPKESHYAQQDYTEDKSLYSGLSWVLQGRGYEEDDANDARQKRMAIQKIPPLYLETVEESGKKAKASFSIINRQIFSEYSLPFITTLCFAFQRKTSDARTL